MASAATTADFSELTLDKLRVALAPAIADNAVFDGWTNAALTMAAEQYDVDPDVAALAFKGGAMAMVGGWIESVDSAMVAAFPDGALDAVPIRERIRLLVQFRLDAIAGQEEALRRATAIMAMPQNLRASLKTGWRSADLMWRLAGDTATDYNHYTKRTILAGIYAATLAVFAGDESEGKAETSAFLDRRIEGVMKFEKAKAKFASSDRDGFSMARFLGRLRYPGT